MPLFLIFDEILMGSLTSGAGQVSDLPSRHASY